MSAYGPPPSKQAPTPERQRALKVRALQEEYVILLLEADKLQMTDQEWDEANQRVDAIKASRAGAKCEKN